MVAGEKRPLLVVLSFLGQVMPWLVLMKGSDYWRIEHLMGRVRRDAASGRPSDREYLAANEFSWDTDADGKTVVKRDGKVIFVEAGSPVATEE